MSWVEARHSAPQTTLAHLNASSCGRHAAARIRIASVLGEIGQIYSP